MKTLLESLFTMCGVLVATELLRRLCPESRTVGFVAGLVALGLLLSTVSAALSLEVDWQALKTPSQSQGEELSDYVEAELEAAAAHDAVDYLEGLFATAGITAEEIAVSTVRNEDGSIGLNKVAARFPYAVDTQRAAALLRGVLGEDVALALETEG